EDPGLVATGADASPGGGVVGPGQAHRGATAGAGRQRRRYGLADRSIHVDGTALVAAAATARRRAALSQPVPSRTATARAKHAPGGSAAHRLSVGRLLQPRYDPSGHRAAGAARPVAFRDLPVLPQPRRS